MSESTLDALASIDERITKLSADFISSHDDLGSRMHTLESRPEVGLDVIEGRIGNLEKEDAQSTEVKERFDQEITAINDWIEAADEVMETLVPQEPKFDLIYTALAAAQLEISNASVNIDNEFTGKKYADLASVLNAVREPLAKNGIALIQATCDPDIEGHIGIQTTLAHKSGQTLVDRLSMKPPKNDPQGIGSCRTYMRRYSLMAMTGIAGAADDDAEGTKQDPDSYDRISPEQIDELLALADKHFKRDADAKVNRMLDKAFQVTAVGDIPATHFDSAINLLNNQKKREDKEARAAKKPTKKGDDEGKE